MQEHPSLTTSPPPCRHPREDHPSSPTASSNQTRILIQGGVQRSPEVAIAMEARLAELENRALDVLAALPTRWPLLGKNRSALGAFMAMHIVRMPSYGALVRQMGERATRDVLSETEHDLDAERVRAEVEAWLRGDGVHADTLWRHVVRFASFLCSMHWTLVEVERDWLITGDQAVFVPPVPQPITPASALLPAGLSVHVEGPFTLDPRRAVLMTWSEDPEERWVSGSHARPAASTARSRRRRCRNGSAFRNDAPPLSPAPPRAGVPDLARVAARLHGPAGGCIRDAEHTPRGLCGRWSRVRPEQQNPLGPGDGSGGTCPRRSVSIASGKWQSREEERASPRRKSPVMNPKTSRSRSSIPSRTRSKGRAEKQVRRDWRDALAA